MQERRVNVSKWLSRRIEVIIGQTRSFRFSFQNWEIIYEQTILSNQSCIEVILGIKEPLLINGAEHRK